MMRLDLKHYHGLHHGNKLYLSYTWPNTRSQKHNPVCSQNNLISSADQPRPLLVYDIFLKQWSSETLSNTRLFCLDKPVWMWWLIKPFRENSAEQILLQLFPGIPVLSFSPVISVQNSASHLLAPTGALLMMMCWYRYFFHFFIQPIDAIDITRVTLSRIDSINAIEVTIVKCRSLDVECRMSNVKKVNFFVGAYLWSSSGHFSKRQTHRSLL